MEGDVGRTSSMKRRDGRRDERHGKGRGGREAARGSEHQEGRREGSGFKRQEMSDREHHD